LKIDKHLKDFAKRLSVISSIKDNDDDSRLIKDDDYYLSVGSDPPRFAYYHHVRAQEWEALGHKPWDGINDDDHDRRITQDELDYWLKMELRISPEERYQHRKGNWFFHDLSYLDQIVDENGKALDIIKKSGCGHWSNKREEGCCVPECRYYLKYGRIEDDEVIQEHNEMVKRHIQENTIVEPPDMDSEEALDFFQRRPGLQPTKKHT